jgi:hypothetical protein
MLRILWREVEIKEHMHSVMNLAQCCDLLWSTLLSLIAVPCLRLIMCVPPACCTAVQV